MQRSTVLLPEPLCPMMATISPLRTLRSTPLRTWLSPNHLCTLSRRTTSVMRCSLFHRPTSAGQQALAARQRQLALEPQAEPGQGVADDEIEHRGGAEIQEWLEGRVVQDLGVVGEFRKADHQGRERGVLDDLHHEAHGRGRGYAHGLGQDDLEHALYAI